MSIEALQDVSLCRGLDRAAAERLSSVTRRVSFLPGAQIVRQNAPARGAYLIRDARPDSPSAGTVYVQGTVPTANVIKVLPELDRAGLNVRIVAAISPQLFRRQSTKYRERICSDADRWDGMAIMNRTLKLGPVIGEPTAGWIIYTSNVNLIDGSSLRLPSTMIRGSDGKVMEMNPRSVDVLVERPVGESYTGKDSQLDAAVKELLKRLTVKSN